MNRAIRLLLGAFTLIACGATLLALLPAVLATGRVEGLTGVLSFSLVMLILMAAVAGVYGAVLALRGRAGWHRPVSAFFAAQIPLVLSSPFSYQACAGACLWVLGTSMPFFGIRYQLGSFLLVGRSGVIHDDVTIGLNVLGLLVAVLLVRAGKAVPSGTSIEPVETGEPGASVRVEP
jgi:hypothetical protein